MLQSISPISFNGLSYEAATKFVGKGGKELGLIVKAKSDLAKSYSFDVLVHDGEYVVNNYTSQLGTQEKSLNEYAKSVFGELQKLSNLFGSYQVKNSDNIMSELTKFFCDAGELKNI